jgi:hypothetical protein
VRVWRAVEGEEVNGDSVKEEEEEEAQTNGDEKKREAFDADTLPPNSFAEA